MKNENGSDVLTLPKDGGYKTALAALPSGVLDALRGLVEWTDHVLAREHRRDIRVKGETFWDESGFLASLFGEATGEPSHQGAKKVQQLLIGGWKIFSDDEKGGLRLQYEHYAALKSALKTVIVQQPFGYKRELENPRVTSSIIVTSSDGKVFVQFDQDRPIAIADTSSKQGKLLLHLGDPFGRDRTVESLAERMGVDEGDITVMKNTMREILRKLAARGKRRKLRLVFDKNVAWLEAA